MEKQLNFGLRMTLEQLALRRVAVNVWNENDILVSIQKCLSLKLLHGDRINVWNETVEVKVKEKISELVVIARFKKQMTFLVEPMGSDILKWKEFHEKHLTSLNGYLDLRILEQLCRNDKGMIDYKETAVKLVHLQALNVVNRYQLACLYCLVDSIPGLFEELPEGYKNIFYDERFSSPVTNINIDVYWTYIVKRKESKLNDISGSPFDLSFNQCAFERLASTCNKAAAEYFYQKLTTEDRDFFVFGAIYNVLRYQRSKCPNYFPVEKVPEILCYLLGLLNPEQQMQILKEHTFGILNCFLDWAWHDFFLVLANIVWTFIPESCYDPLLIILIEKVDTLSHYFSSFFQIFFRHSPISFKKYFARSTSVLFFLKFIAEDTETIKTIFRNLEVEDRMRLVSACISFGFIARLLVDDKEHLVKLYLREATLSEENRETLKKIFEDNNALDIQSKSQEQRKLQLFKQILDEIYSSPGNKRSSDRETLNNAKKFS